MRSVRSRAIQANKPRKPPLAKLLNLLVDRQEISEPNGGPVEVTDHRTRIVDRLNAIAKRQAPDNDRASGGA